MAHGSKLCLALSVGLFACSFHSTGTAEDVASTASAVTTACTYPAGPYGTAVGDVLPKTLSWKGFAAGATATTSIGAADLFDCDGSKGVNAVVLDVSASWCPSCQEEAPSVETQIEGAWGADGVRILTLLVEDENRGPASTQTARDWIDAFGLAKLEVVADPGDTFSVHALPTNILVDPRTMKIVSIQEGYDDTDQSPDTLAKSNAKVH
jgi:hypothetical protein